MGNKRSSSGENRNVHDVPHPLQFLKDKWDELTKQRDEIYAEAEPHEKRLHALNLQILALQEQADLESKQIETIWNSRGSWLELKSSINGLAKALSKPGGLLATKE